VGLSLAIGAFLAGLIISESEYSTSAFAQVLPFRDLFTSFFFISIGMLLDVGYLFNHLGLVLLVTFGVLGLKAIISGLAGTLIGLSFLSALLLGFALAQVGEFSFILSKFGLEEGLILSSTYQLFLAVSVISMAAAPFIIAAAPWLSSWILKLPFPGRIRSGLYPIKPVAKTEKKDHLIIIGFGVNGKNLANAAKVAEISYVIIEMNPATVRIERGRGEPILYGDATQETALLHAGLRKAKAVVIAIPDAAATGRITELARRANPKVYLLVRTRFLKQVERLYELGADHVIPEEFETSIEIFAKVLPQFSIPEDRIEQYVTELKSECYRLFRSGAPDTNPDTRLEDEPSSD
jgi:CPA2 family monovalent cation:H+ antiporter-2